MPGAFVSGRRGAARLATLAGGAVLLAASAWAAGGGLAPALGVPAGSLAWGDDLFCLLLAFHGVLLIVAGWRRRRPDRAAAAALTAEPSERDGGRAGGLAWRGALVALTAAALALRLWHLDSGLWHDEIGTLLEFVRPDPGTILTSFRNQNQHMLYSLAAHASIAVFGESAAALRLPAALFGAACVPALFLLARRVVPVGEALLACALLTVSYHHIWFSQNARGYTGVLFFTLLATWLWLAALASDAWRHWLGYVAAVALGMWVHLTMAFVVAAHGLVFLGLAAAARRPERPGDSPPRAAARDPRRALAAYVLCVTVTAQLYALGLPAFFASGLHEVSLDSDWIRPLWLVVETLRGLAAGFSGPALSVGLAVLAAIGVLVATGWWSLWRRDRALAVVAVLPGALVVGLMVALRHNLWPRFLFFCAGFALLVVVRGAFDLAARLARRAAWPPARGRAAATVVLAVLVVASLASLPRYYALPKQDYEGALDFVSGRLGPRDVAVAVGLARVAYEGLYAVGRPGWRGAEDAATLAELRRAHDRVWLVYSLETHLRRWHPDVWRLIESDFEEVRVFPGTLRGGEVRVLRLRTRPPEGVDGR